jgi:hypothetical protein
MYSLNRQWTLVFIIIGAFSAWAAPTWWSTRSLLNTNPADDYAVANIGQLKYVSTKARLELNSLLPTGAGATINDLVLSWEAAPVAGVTRDDFAILNQGQLKTIAGHFYDRLAQYGYAGAPLAGANRYPWSDAVTDDDDYAAVNIGQLKYVFSFLSAGYIFDSYKADWDLDYLPDGWEVLHGFSTMSNSATDDGDGDTSTALAEYKAGTSPLFRQSNSLGLEIYTP